MTTQPCLTGDEPYCGCKNCELVSSSAVQPTLEWAINKFGSDFFSVRWLWTRNTKVYRWETRSTLEKLNGYENVYGGLTNYGLAAAMRNAARMVRGDDKESVKVFAFRLVARIVPKQRRMRLPIPTVSMMITEHSVPMYAQHQEIDIQSFYIDITHFEQDECEKEMVRELGRLGLSPPMSVEYDPMYPLHEFSTTRPAA